MPRFESAADLQSHRSRLLAAHDASRPCVTICSGTGCHAARSDQVHHAFQEELLRAGLRDKVDILRTGCQGFCERGTIVSLQPNEVTYLQVKPEDAAEIVAETLVKGKVVDRLLYETASGQRVALKEDIPFYTHQMPVVFGLNHLISPTDVDSYILLNGYGALAKALFEMSPQASGGRDQSVRPAGKGRWRLPHRAQVADDARMPPGMSSTWL